MQTRRIVTSTSIERRSTSGIKRGHDTDTKAYGVLKVDYDASDRVRSAEVLARKPWRLIFASIVEIS